MKIKLNNVRQIKISGEYIRLDSLLKFANIVMSGGEAKTIIANGDVYLNGVPEIQRGKKIRPGDVVRFGNETVKIAGK